MSENKENLSTVPHNYICIYCNKTKANTNYIRTFGLDDLIFLLKTNVDGFFYMCILKLCLVQENY